MVTVEELVKLMNNPGHRLRVFVEGQQEFIGFIFDLTDYSPEKWQAWRQREIKKFRCTLDITHKEWRQRGLIAPLEPDKLATYQFSDLQTELYYEIYL